MNQKEKHVSIRHNRVLTLMNSGAPLSRIDMMYMIYLDVKFFEKFVSVFTMKNLLSKLRLQRWDISSQRS